MPEGGPQDNSDARLRAHVRELGQLLGQTEARQEGQKLLDLVEEVRHAVRRDAAEARTLLESFDLPTATRLARAFSIFFDLANIAEQVERSRGVAEQTQMSRFARIEQVESIRIRR